MRGLSELLPHLANAGVVVLLSGLLGFEREVRRRPAGLKTHILVGLASWLLVVVGLEATERYAGRSDPIRIVQAVVYGISFIGAGTIFTSGRDNNRVRGLTTAASLLAATSIAVAVGFDELLLACAVTAMILVVQLGIGALERRLIATNRDPED